MAIKRPDIYEHNNPNLAISDTDFHRGGFRSAVGTVSDLYALSGKTGYPSAPGQLKEFSTIVYVSGETTYYVLTDIDNVGNSNGWEVFQAGSSGITETQNIGSGIGVYSGITGTTLLLRSIVGSGDTSVSLSGDSIIVHSNTGSTTLNSGILRFDSGQQTFLPYTGITTVPSNIIFYTGTTCPCPTGNTRMALNARLTVTELRLSTGRTDVSGVTHSPGDLYWDDEDSTITLHQTADVQQQIGQELYVKARNNSGGLIPNGSVVYISGSLSGRPTISPARASQIDGGIVDEVVGMTTENIFNNQDGFVTTTGLVRDIQITGFTEGDIAYLSTTVWGGITNVKPEFPDYAVEVGIVTNTGVTNGRILIRVNNISTVSENTRGVEVINPPFTASTRSDIISSVGAGTIYLPASPLLGQQITVIDHDGDALLFNITIDGNGKNINGDTQATINTNYGSMTFVYNGVRWYAAVITP